MAFLCLVKYQTQFELDLINIKLEFIGKQAQVNQIRLEFGSKLQHNVKLYNQISLNTKTFRDLTKFIFIYKQNLNHSPFFFRKVIQ